jgi:hypothetical protein
MKHCACLRQLDRESLSSAPYPVFERNFRDSEKRSPGREHRVVQQDAPNAKNTSLVLRVLKKRFHLYDRFLKSSGIK